MERIQGERSRERAGIRHFVAARLPSFVEASDERDGAVETIPAGQQSAGTTSLPSTPPRQPTSNHRSQRVPTSAASPSNTLRIAGLPSRLPSPISPTSTRSTIGAYPGPADTDSIASSALRWAASPRRRALNPEAPPFNLEEARSSLLARRYLNRGQDPQPEARDPMDVPDDRPVGAPVADGEAVGRRVASARRHLAIAWRRMSAADRDHDADELEQIGDRLFGEAFQEERAWAIQHVEDESDREEGNEREEEIL